MRWIASRVRRLPVCRRERAGHDPAEVLGLLEEVPRDRIAISTGALVSSIIMYVLKPSDAASRSPEPSSTDAVALAERPAWATRMAACAPIAWPRCLDCRLLSNSFTTRTVISSTSSPDTVSVVSGLSPHQRR